MILPFQRSFQINSQKLCCGVFTLSTVDKVKKFNIGLYGSRSYVIVSLFSSLMLKSPDLGLSSPLSTAFPLTHTTSSPDSTHPNQFHTQRIGKPALIIVHSWNT